MQKLVPCLWFDHQAEEAAQFYTSIFKNSRITGIARYGEAGSKASGQPKGSVMTVTFELEGQPFVGLNGGPRFQFTPAISFVANCETQAELDELWGRLGEGGEIEQCGWLRDRFGISWQIVPANIQQMAQADPERSDRMMQAILQMVKIDIATVDRVFRES